MNFSGWGDLLDTTNAIGEPVDVGDATPAILMAIVLYCMPSKPYFVTDVKNKRDKFRYWSY